MTADREALDQEIAERRNDEAFMARISERVRDDAALLARIADDAPFLVEPGWTQAVCIPHVGGPTYRVLFYPDGTARFEHRCDRGERGVIICAPLLQLASGGHRIVQDDPLTITPSILCPDCGTHGFITEGRWQ